MESVRARTAVPVKGLKPRELCGDGIRRIVRSRLGRLGVPEQELDDLVQETLAALLTSKIGYDPSRGTLHAWVSGCAANVARSWWRKSGEKHRVESPLEEECLAMSEAELARFGDTVAEPFGELSPQDQDLLRFRYEYRLSFDEIEDLTSLSAATARKRVSRSLARLRSSHRSAGGS